MGSRGMMGATKLWKGYLVVIVTLLAMTLLYFSYYSFGLGGPDHIVISDKLNSVIRFFLIDTERSGGVTQAKSSPWYLFHEDEAIRLLAVAGVMFAIASLLWTLKLRKVYHLRPYCAFAASFSVICLIFGVIHLFRL